MDAKLRLPLLVLLLIGIAGCSPTGSSTAEGPAKPSGAESSGAAQYRIAVVPKGLGHDFWNKVKAGAEAAARENNAVILWDGPATEADIDTQISIIEGHVADKVDAIVMAACDANALIAPVQKAVDAGIPVITIDSGLNSDLPLSLIATDNEAGAALAADELDRLLGGSGEVGLISFLKGAKTSDLRESGFLKGLAKHPGLKLVSTQYCNSQSDEAMNNVQDMLSAHPQVRGIFASNEPAAIGAARALELRGKTGEVKLVAFDAAPAEVEALKKGVIQALIVQDPYRMGFEGVLNAVRALKKQPVEKRIDTGVTVVTAENLNEPDIQKLVNAIPAG